MSDKKSQLDTMIAPVVEELGYEYVGCLLINRGRYSVLRVYIDAEDGIDVEDCAATSHQLSGVLDVEDPIPGEYNLEISSPGLDRPLFIPEHYQRFAGTQAKIRLRSLVKGRRNLQGTLRGMINDEVVIEMDGEQYSFPVSMVERANLVPEFSE